ncbi:MAG: hypothetical protein NVV73_01930 [Cellvibrionaceae bacterium]|nr:hypothetical protein [Cellvibrionaceae bacterium]
MAVPELRPGQNYSITPFSHMAFKFFVKDLVNLEGNESSLSLIQAQNLISRANTRLASRFGLVADLPTLGQIDVTDPSEIGQAQSSVIRDSVLSSAILQSANHIYSNQAIANILTSIAEQYVEVGLPGVIKSTKVVSYALLMRTTKNILEELQLTKGLDLSQTISGVQAELDLVSLEEPDQYSHGIESRTHSSPNLEKGVEFVSDVRRVANSLDLRKIAALGSLAQIMDGGASDLLQQFGINFGSSSILDGDGFRDIQAALGFVSEAVLASLIDYYANGVISSSHGDVLFTHSYSNNSHLFTFTSTIYTCEDGRSCPVDLSLGIRVQIDRFMGNASARIIAARSIGVDLVGFIRASNLTLNFLDQESQIVLQRPLIESISGEDGVWKIENYHVEGESIAVRLPIEFRQQDPMATELSRIRLSADVGEHLINFSQRSSLSIGADGAATHLSEDLIHVGHLEGFRFGVANAVTNSTKESVLGVLNLVQAPEHSPENITLKTSVVSHCAVPTEKSTCEELSSNSFIEGETPENYLILSASAGFRTKLKGFSEPVILELSGSRDSPTTNSINNMRVSYPGHAVSLNGRFNNSGGITGLNATNLEGMRLYLNSINGKRSGALETPGKEKVADLIDMGQWIKIRYINGDFESL